MHSGHIKSWAADSGVLEAQVPQKHFMWTTWTPWSTYSCFLIHMWPKFGSDDKIDPPFQTEFLRSGGAITLIFMVDGANAVSSFAIRSLIPENIVVPPDSTTLAYISLRILVSHFMIAWKVVSWMPGESLPIILGWNRASGHLNRSAAMVITLPSGSSNNLSLSAGTSTAFISVSKSNAT